MKFRVSEYFYSIQGEGLHVGTPSVFLRMFGCNFKCEGFGMPKGEKSVERLAVNPINFQKFEDLPLVETGCDSYSSWDPRFKKFAKHFDASELADELLSLSPVFGGSVHLVITGGEPLLGWQKIYPLLFDELIQRGKLMHVTFETNGTQELTEEFMYYLQNCGGLKKITFSVSAKLSASGEKWEDAIKPEIVAKYTNVGEVVFKFVVDQNTPIEEIDKAVYTFQTYTTEGGKYFPEGLQPLLPSKIYLMPEGGTSGHYNANARAIAQLCMDNGYRYSPRLHIDLFGNAWGT